MSTLAELLGVTDRRRAFMTLANWFRQCSAEDRAAIVAGWPFGADWEYPSPWKLAWPDGSGDSTEDRVVALLIYYCIEGVGPDARDVLIAFAVIHNAAILAGMDPRPLFLEARALADSSVRSAFDAFLSLPEDQKSMAAFMLKVVSDVDGQPKLTIAN